MLTLMSQVGINLLVGAEIPLDEKSILSKAEALEAQSTNAQTFTDKKNSAEALYFLTVKASEIPGLSKVTQLSLITSVCESFSRYLRAIPSPSPDLASFAASPGASNSISVLESALRMIPQSAPSPVFPNVSPPRSTPGPTASGMDPKSVKDPKARAEYEQRIAKNNQALEESNAQVHLKRAVADLKEAIKNIVGRLTVDGHAASLKTIVKNSEIAPEIKADILDEPRRQE